MPVQFTYDDIFLALAQEAFRGQEIIDLTTTDAGTTTTALFDQLAYGSSGAVTTRFHDQYLYLRRIRGTATAGAATTITLESGHDFGLNTLANFTIKITSGTGSGQERTITSNTADTPSVVTVPTWTTNPSTDSVYAIYPSSSALPVPTVVRASKAQSTSSFTVASGTVTVAPAYTCKILTRSDMVFCSDIQPDELKRSINTVLRSIRFKSYLPVTMVTDGDLEDTGVTNWAAIGTPGTREKTATVFPFGRQALHLVSDALDEGATSNNVPVANEETLILAVPIKITSGTVDVILYDATNSTALRTVTVSDIEPVMVYFQEPPDSTTKNVTVRAESATAVSEWYVGPVCLISAQRSRYPLDTTSVTRPVDVRGLYRLPLYRVVETDVYLISEPLELLTRDIERDDRAGLMNIVLNWHGISPGISLRSRQLSRPGGYAPIFMETWQRWPELTYDTETTYADRDTVVAGAMALVARARGDEIKARAYNSTFNRMLQSQAIDPVEFTEIYPARVEVPFR